MAARTGLFRLLAGFAGCALVAAAAHAAVGPGGSDLAPANPNGLQSAPGPGLPGLAPGTSALPNRAVLAAALAASMAADSLIALAAELAPTGNVPRQSDAKAAPLLDAVLNVPPSLTRGNLGRGDTLPLLIWLASVQQVATLYVSPTSGPLLYAAETGRASDARLALSAAVADAVAGSVIEIGASDAGQSGLEQIRSGIVQALADAIASLPRAGVDADWRAARITALVAAAPHVSAMLLTAQCSALRAAADKAALSVPDAPNAGGLRDFGVALAC